MLTDQGICGSTYLPTAGITPVGHYALLFLFTVGCRSFALKASPSR